MLEAVRRIDRNGKKIFICPLCGHVFYNSKEYTKHLNKSHLRKLPSRKRRVKKMLRQLTIIKIKEENNIPLTKYEKYLKLRSKLNNIKL